MNERPWFQSYDSAMPTGLTYEPALIPSILSNTAEQFPDHTALNFFGYSMSYRELWGASRQFARALQQLGVRDQERVALYLPNCPQFIIAYFALTGIGAVAVPTNPLYTEKELQFQLTDSGAETLITLDLLYGPVHAVRSATALKRIVVGKIQDYLPPLKKMMSPIVAPKGKDAMQAQERDGVVFFRRMMRQQCPPLRPPAGDWNSLAQLQYTGGTTGVAKGAMLTHRNIVCNNLQARTWYAGIEPAREIFISVLPFFHSYGLAVAMNLAISTASTMLIFPKFVPRDILKAITRYRATVVPGIPSIYSVIASYKDVKKYNVSSINFCLSGAAPLPDSVLHEFEQVTGGILLEGYGLSEASPITHCNPVIGTRKVGSIGLPMPDTDCKIIDIETGAPVKPGEPGELAIRGPQVMQGYWNRAGETAETLRDGWLLTGDVARMDDEGYFYIVERKKDMIISEGFNIYPREVEEFLMEHPAVADAAVVGEPDKLRGERVLACVVAADGQEVTVDELMKYCRENLVKYKIPKKIIFTDAIPTNIAGKKIRRKLRGSGDASAGENA